MTPEEQIRSLQMQVEDLQSTIAAMLEYMDVDIAVVMHKKVVKKQKRIV